MIIGIVLLFILTTIAAYYNSKHKERKRKERKLHDEEASRNYKAMIEANEKLRVSISRARGVLLANDTKIPWEQDRQAMVPGPKEQN